MKNFTISTFFNQLTAMPKRLAMVLTVLFTLGVGCMCGAETTYTFTNSNWNAKIGSTSANWTNGKAGAAFANNGVQVTTNATGANATSPKSFENISQIIVTYNTNKNSGAGTLKIKVGDNTEKSNTCGYSGSSDGRTANFTSTFNFSPTQSGRVKLTVNTTTNSIYVVSVKIITEDVVKTPTSITLSEAGQTSNPSGTFYVGDLYQLPSTTTATCGDKTFVGWSTVTIDNSANKPTSNFYAPGASVTLGANNTFYAVFAESGGTGSTSWEKTDISGISSSDVVVITMSKSGVTYAMMNNGGTSSPPGAEKITIDGNTIESTVYDTYKWNISNSSGNLTIYPNGTTSSWLYCTATNNGVRVGTNTNKTFTISGNYLKHTYTSRFVGVYLNNPDWRCYTGTTGTNIDSQTLAFYKKTTTSGYQNYTTECSTPTEFTVSFDANDHGTAPDEQIVASGQKATEPTPAPTATGYTFGGWYKEPKCENEFDFNTAITADITLYAKWTPITYTVTFNHNGGTGTMSSQTFTYNQAQTLTANTFTRTGYTFNGWNTKSDGSGDSYTNSQSVKNLASTNGATITLYAQWKIQTFTVVFDKNGGTGTMASQIFTYNQAQTLTANTFTRTGYTFNGWNTQANGQGTTYTDQQSVTLTTAGLTLYAQWKANTYTVKFDGNGSDGGSMPDQSFTYGQSQNLTANAFTRTNYAFKNWNTKADGSGTAYTDKQSVSNLTTANGETVTLYAQWTPTYTITWLANEQEFHKQENAVEGTALDVPDSEPDASEYACDDKVFVGWTAAPIGGTTDDEPADLFTTKNINVEEAATTYYAVFATADAGGGSTGETTTVAVGDQVVIIQVDNNTTELTGFRSDKVITDNNNYGTHAAYNTTPSATLVWTIEEGASNGTFAFKNDDYYLNLGVDDNNLSCSTTKNANSSWTITESNGRAVVTNVQYTSRKIMWNQSSPRFASYAKNHGLNTNQYYYHIKFYKLNGGTSYSDYTTSCVKLPDPVWEGATIDKTSFTVNCGERSPMTGANGAAKITFPTEKIYNFTKDITIEATTGFLVSTSQTEDANYKSLVYLSPLVGTANANTFYEKPIYVRAEAPAQSDTDLEGTITIKNSKGETLQTFSVTADVTCIQYTLTLVDRGVSTEQPTKYYAGETIDEAPADPEGVCTDPIHYVFDGWAAATVSEGATEYTKVTFPYTVTGNTKFYAVYRYLEGGGNGDYNLVTSALDDWSGDYLIAYSDQIFANGTIGGESGIGAKNNKVDLSSNISNNTIPATVGDQYNVTLEAVTGGYVLKTQDGKYNYHTNNTGNGISASTIGYADDYPISVDFVSEEEINLCLGGSAIGSVFRYNAQGFFRFYKNGGQNPVYLYKKADGTTYYTTSPICGPHLAITEGKDIYVTGGNAGGTRDLVIAQQKVSYKATRLQTSNGLADGTAPDVKVATNGITVGGVVTSDVKVTIDQTKEQQTDGTYTITGTITVQYQPSANNKQEDIQVQLAVDYNSDAKDAFIVHARSLPQEFVIVAKQGDKWYALNGDMSNGSSANPANGQVTLDDNANPTKATYAPCNTIYTFDGLPNTGDRTYVRFQGTDGAWLWASSGSNVGIQNNVLKTTPEGSNKAYNWKLYTEDNITYRFGNANSSRQLTLNGEKFGMYASGVQDIRILPYEAKCLYNYAPSNLKVSVLKGTYVTLTWDAVVGATKYQYSTNGTTWTDAGTEPTVTINGLTGDTEYTYYIRAYHEDAGVSQECIDYAEITFTTADCDDVPTDITYTADLNSITVSWTAAAPTSTIKLFMDEEGAHMAGSYPGAKSPYRISGGLKKNTTYYIQILADGTCASPIVPVKTEDVEVDIVEWQPQGIIVDINTDETIGVTLENEVSYGSNVGAEATELFFSKYYEASYNVKLVAIYNGTKNIIDLTDYVIKYGKTSWESNYITLKDFGATKGQIQPGEEIILYSMQDGTQDDEIMDCVHEDFPDGNWVRVTSSNNTGKGTLSFAGDKTLALFKEKNIIDIIGAVNGSIPNNSKANEKPAWGDAKGWICATGLSLADDSEIGISTNRCLLVRNNTVTSGANAVASNTTDFFTLCSEWKGAHVLDSDVDNGIQESCENFAYIGTFDYSDYYTKYESMGEGTTFEENDRNPDGTVTIPITDLYKHACSNIRVKLTNSNGEVLSDREYKVPIMITTNQGTDGEAFIALQQNLATKEVDGEGNVIATYPLSLDQVREICKTCDVVVRDNATLTKIADDAANDHPQVRNVYVYENSSLIVPNGTNYTINNLSLRRNQDAVASVSTHPDALKLPESAAAPISLDFRLSAENWHWFTLPYDCNINEVTWADGTPAQYNTDWYLMTYDGEKRAATQAGGCWKAYTGTTIKAGEGFIIAINGNINNPKHTYELRFPMSKEVLAAEGTDKTVAVRAWGVETNIRPNHKGWNLVGNPYLAYYQRNNITNFEGLRLGQLTGPDPQTGYWEQTGDVPYVVVPVGAGWIAYEQVLASETDLLPFTAYFVQVGNDGEHKSSDELSISFDHTKLQLSATPMPASIIQRATSETDVIEPVIVGVSLTNSLGESDKTSLVIDNQFTDEYEMNADFFKWFGDYYKYYTKPVVYSLGADNGKRAFNALSEDLATQPISLGMYAAQAGNYTFTLDRRSDLSKVQEVWLYDATQDKYTNLMQDSYTFNTAKTESAGRFFLSVKMAPKVSTDINNVTDGTIWATTQDHTIFVNGLLSNAQLWIYDATGKLLHTDQTQYYQHTYQAPVSGTYFVRVRNTMQTQTIKVVVE